MGTSKRYADHFDRLMDDRIAQNAMNDHEPDTLTSNELQLDTEPLTKAPVPRPVSAWVRYGTTPLRIDALAVAWTDYAVAIKWAAPGGEHHAWVWASAVRPRKPSAVAR
jgi:hypothetical protein